METTKENKLIYLWEMLLLAVLALGAYAAMQIFSQGHRILEISSETPWGSVALGVRWGMLISTYVFFVVSSTGLCIISSIGHVFGVKEYLLIGRTAVFLSIVTLITGYLPLLVHLGHPERLVNYITTPNFSSSMWWMGFFYSFYFVFIVAEFIFLLGGRMRMVKVTGAIAVVAAVSAHTTLGTVFSRVEAAPLWYGSYYPLYFILSAVISGAGIITLATILTYRKNMETNAKLMEFMTGQFRKLFAFLLALGILFVAWKAIASVRHIETYEAMLLLLTGTFSLRFWMLQVLAGAVIPLLMLMKTRSLPGLSAASFLVILGIFTARYDWTIAGQVIPAVSLLEGLKYYVPPAPEVRVVAGAFAFCLLAYTLGARHLSLEAKE